MQIRLTVLGPLSGHTTCACDVLVTAPSGTALAAVASGLAAAVAAAGSDLGSGAVVVHAGTERLDAQRCALGEPPLIDGAVLSLGAPADPERHAGVLPSGMPDAVASLHVVSGPDAGGVHLLHGGEVRVGRSSSADVPLDDPDVSRLHCAVTLADDGSVTLHDLGSTNGTTLEGESVDGMPVALPPGALVRVGESTLSLYGTNAPAPLPAAPDGEGHLRVGPAAAGADRGPAATAATSSATGLARFGAAADHGPAPVAPGSTSHAAGFAHLTDPPAGDGIDRAAAAGPEAPSTEGRRLGRGIGAWARRLAGGRGGDRRGPDDAAEGLAPGDAVGGGSALTTAAALRERWPDPAAVLLTALGPGPRLWERGPDHPDLLTVRLGTADRYGPDGSGPLPSVPVTVSLRQAGALGLAGPRARLSGLARSVLAQLAALHAPTTLEYVLISADRSRPVEERLAEWSWLGWLPQLRPAHGQDCRLLLAYDREQAEARTAELVRRLDDGPLGPHWTTAPPEAVATAAAGHRGPYTVLIVDGDPGSAALRETVARLAVGGPAAGVHLLCLADAPATTPASPVSATLATAEAASPAFPHCGTVALLSGDVATVVQVIHRTPAPVPSAGGPGQASRPMAAAPAGAAVIGALDAVSGAWAERFARALAPLRKADGAGDPHASRIAAALPRTARLLDELGLARATPASLTARWAAATDRGARPGGRAVAVLGAGPHGPLTVDLAADGPHLLVEGGPGSGKTELLRSLAASLAAADRPDRLSLVLVDGAAAERGEGLRVCTDLPHVSTYLAAADPVRMREFAQALSSELKRRAELLGTLDFTGWHDRNPVPAPAPAVVAPRRPSDPVSGDLEPAPSGTLKLRTQREAPTRTADTALPRLVVLVDDFDALVAPALGSTGRPAAGSVVRALEAVARDGERLGVHLIAASGRPERTADTAAVERAGLRATLEIAPPMPDAPAGAGPDGGSGAGEPAPGRGRLQRPDDAAATPFQAGRVTGRIPRTATQRPTVVPLDWQRTGDPPTRRPLRELGNGPTDLALLASALQRAAQSAGAQAAPPLL
ncbi:FtsK/SpoIIIE domain-containing protein [Streptomyces sp. NPDC021096]|uniref:FtsK/SpoIIIE domain-containing protein n=1 Tax=Streptomyces sp. NPDC021096 TaxID=3154792 RepID=UPI00340D4A61